MQDACDFESLKNEDFENLPDCTKDDVYEEENVCESKEKSTLTEEICDIQITLPSFLKFDFDKFSGNDYSNIQNLDNYEKCIRFYRYMCQFSGTTLVLMYYVENNPQFFDKTFPNQMLDLLFPFFIGSTFGKVITPVAFFYYCLS
jgi:hypothetical protein